MTLREFAVVGGWVQVLLRVREREVEHVCAETADAITREICDGMSSTLSR